MRKLQIFTLVTLVTLVTLFFPLFTFCTPLILQSKIVHSLVEILVGKRMEDCNFKETTLLELHYNSKEIKLLELHYNFKEVTLLELH